MLKIKVYLIVGMLGCILWHAPAGAECWRWEKKTIPGAPALADAKGIPRITYDESTQKLVVALYWGGLDDIVDLWTYDGTSWDLVWSENPIPGLVEVAGLYFDRNLDSLVMFGTYAIWFEQSACAFFKFVPGQGWVRIAQDFPFTVCPPGVGYDTNRKRAVMATSWDYNYSPPKPLTIEFDGSKFYYFYMQEELNFVGPLGYDVGTSRMVYFDWSGTYTYQGGFWTKVETVRNPVFDLGGYLMMGMIYVPEFGGIVGIPENLDLGALWVFKTGDWRKIEPQNILPGRHRGAMSYDPQRNTIVVHGGIIEGPSGGEYSHDTWELEGGHHCRPLAKP
jgi:hypothetical protein